MTDAIILYAAFLLAIVSCGLSIFAFQLAMARHRNLRDIRTIVLHLSELEDMHEALAASHKRLRSRVGMQDLRARRKSEKNGADDQPEAGQLDSEAWKRQKRLELASGKLKA